MFHLLNILNRVRARLWLVPSIMSVAAVGLAWLMLYSGWAPVVADDDAPWWLFSGDKETARGLLSSLLSGLITLTGLVVSITIVVLSLAAAQLGPRVIVNYLRDLQIQSVFGLFIGSILYTLLIFRSITGAFEEDGVLHLAVTLASGLAMLCLMALLFYVDKLARSTIADTVIYDIASELHAAIDGRGAVEAPPRPDRPLGDDLRRTVVALGRSGYIQVIDYQHLTRLAARSEVTLEVAVRPGQFVLAGGDHVIARARHALPDEAAEGLRAAFTIGPERTPTQDIEYPIRQLVEIALRALSPGINDPHTALAVIDRLTAALEQASGTDDPQARFFDRDGALRVVANTSHFAGLVDTAFNEIRQAADGNAAVLIGLVRALSDLAGTMPEDRLAPVATHAGKIARAARRSLAEPADLEDFEMRLASLEARLARGGGTEPVHAAPAD